jgi:hypothetical protein
VLDLTNSADDTTIILPAAKAVSRYMDLRLGRFFTKDAAALAREYSTRDLGADGDRASGLLYVDDIATTAGLSILVDTLQVGSFAGLTPLAATEYELRPRNAALGPDPWPYTEIALTSWGTSAWSGPVQITAVWGWPAVPEAIKQACIQLVGILLMKSPRATREVNLGLGTVLATSSAAQSIIGELMSVYSRNGGVVVA